MKKKPIKEDIIETATGELHFANLRIANLKNALDEITTLKNNNLASAIAKNYLERDNLDVLVHAQNIV